jgi:hypothetical protein
MSMFKQKNKKIFIGDKRITLDAKHNEMLKKFKEIKKLIPNKKLELQNLRDELRQLELNETEVIELDLIDKKFDIQNGIRSLESELKKLQKKDDEKLYFIQTGDILYNYYDDIENVADNTKDKRLRKDKKHVIQSSNINIMNFFKDDKNTEDDSEGTALSNQDNISLPGLKMSDYVDTTKKFDRAQQLDYFSRVVDPKYCPKSRFVKNIDNCPKCFNKLQRKIEMILNTAEGNLICERCGHMEYVVIDSDKPSYKDPPPEATYFAYKRINHFNELLNQIQAKESTDIPPDVFEKIQLEIKKERIIDLSRLTNDKIRSYLKKLRLNKYYEHVPHIINKLNGLPPPILTRDVEEKLRIMFREIQGPFMEICPKDRKNFLNYYYVFHKFVQLLDLDEYKSLFTLLKSRDKLHQQDLMWKKICAKLGWQYIKSI